MPLSWNEIRIQAAGFAERWKDESSESAEKQTFWNEFFSIFGMDRRSVALYEKAVDRFSGATGFIDLFVPGQLIVEHKSGNQPLDPAFDQAADYALLLSPSDRPRYIITSNFHTFRLYDLVTVSKQNEWTFSLKDLAKNIGKFGFIAGYNKQEVFEEDPVNRQAAERLAELHDQLTDTGYKGHDLEVLLVRLLFCLFAEDSHVFEKGIFHDFIYDRTDIDGSNLGAQLNSLFEVLNTPKEKRQSNLDETLAAFPYVNGKLFTERIAPASFDHKMRDRILNAAHDINWSEISPAIFGAMFQGVIDPKIRRHLGAHYTSEQNIIKVIKPLFLDALWEEFNKAKDYRPQLNEFHDKLGSLTFMDPACGCGNFLVVTYRELRKLELEVLKTKYSIPGLDMKEMELDLSTVTRCNVDQFYGLEIEEFPAQIAQVALWLTDMQMNNEAADYFGKPLLRLPLTQSPTIVQGDALTTDWEELIEPSKLSYLLGNPPYAGYKLQDADQKIALSKYTDSIEGGGILDFVCGWFLKAAKYTEGTTIMSAFVATNSIVQGEHVTPLWRTLFNKGIHINFAHQTFKWSNEGRGSAGVHCVIVGFSYVEKEQVSLFEYISASGDPHELIVNHINGYLLPGEDIFIEKRSKPFRTWPAINYGNEPREGNFLIFDSEDSKNSFIDMEPLSEKFIRRFMSAEDFINRTGRWCLWLVDASPGQLREMPHVLNKLREVRDFRKESKQKAAHSAASTPSLFVSIRQPDKDYLLIPIVSSENRRYIPVGWVDKDVIASNAVFTSMEASLFHFGVLISEMHMTWMRHICGRLESRYRYSNTIVYNTFPWPNCNEEEQENIANLGKKVLDARNEYPGDSLAEMYDPLTMQPTLQKAHQALDAAVDELYRKEKFTTDSERMQLLLALYKGLANIEG
ncbi:MAG: hypothetical protein JWO96_842 [Candidatus Saccharibacteria bacterium]|nr:hypothetical protein [Candidatus Saccharibacteria bacterium]